MTDELQLVSSKCKQSYKGQGGRTACRGLASTSGCYVNLSGREELGQVLLLWQQCESCQKNLHSTPLFFLVNSFKGWMWNLNASGYYSIKNKDVLHLASLRIQAILTFFQIKIAPRKLVRETCTYSGKKHYLPLDAELNVQMLLLRHMWSSSVFYSCLIFFFMWMYFSFECIFSISKERSTSMWHTDISAVIQDNFPWEGC